MDFLNDSHFITNNRTAPNLTPEEMKRAEEISSSILEALRRAGVDLPA
jgi:ferredoxin